MGGQTTTETTQNSSSTTNPWAKAQPLLDNIISQLGGQSTSPTGAQTTAANNLVTAANNIPDLSASEIGAVKNLFNANSQPQQDMLTGAYSDLRKNLGGYLDPSYLNPMTTPGLSDALSTMQNDINNSISGQFAAAGRDFSPAQQTYTARGLSQGLGGLLIDQYNKNVAAQQGAAGAVFSGAGTTANGVNALQKGDLNAGIAGLNAASGLGGLLTQPAQTQLAAATTQAGLPLSTLAQYEQLALPLAALGSQTTGSSQGTQTTTKDPTSSIIGAGIAGLGLLSGNPMGLLGGMGSLGGLLGGGGGYVGNYGQTANASGLGAGTGGLSFPMFL